MVRPCLPRRALARAQGSPASPVLLLSVALLTEQRADKADSQASQKVLGPAGW